MTRSPSLHCGTCPLRPSGIFRRLPAELLRLLDQGKVPQTLVAGQILFDEGAPPFAVHCIRSGAVKVTKLGPGGEERIVRVLHRGEVVGYRAVLAGEPYGAKAEALEATTVCTVPAPVLVGLIRHSPEFALDVLAKLAQELRISEDVLIDLQHKSVHQRLAGALLLLTEPRIGVPRLHAAVRLSRLDLARLIGTSPESVSRALRRFGVERTVLCSRREIRVLDPDALRRAAGSDPLQHIDLGQVGD